LIRCLHQLESDENYISESSLTLSVTEQVSLRLSASGFYFGSVGFETRLGKGKVKVDCAHGRKVYGGDGGIAPLPGHLTPDDTRWFKYDRDYLCVNKSQFVPVIFEPPCIFSGDSNRTLGATQVRSGRFGEEENLIPQPRTEERFICFSACGIFTILTELSGLGHRLAWRVCCELSVFRWPTSASLCSLPNSFLADHPTIRHCVAWDTDSLV
jgi:hypothetical protein